MRASCKLFLVLTLVFKPIASFAADITTRDGTTYHNAKVTGVDPDGIRVTHASGVAKLPFEDLPDTLQKQYHYDAAKVAGYRKQVDDAQKAASAKAAAAAQERQREIEATQETARRKAEEQRTLQQEGTAGQKRQQTLEMDNDASKNADEFLAALKIFEIPEGKEAAIATAWPVAIEDLPVLAEQHELFEGMFATDAPGVLGYKRLLQASVQSQSGSPLTEKYLLVSYRPSQNGKWKVWKLARITKESVEDNIAGYQNGIQGTESRYMPIQYYYRHYGYWLCIAGKLRAGKQALETALQLDQRAPEDGFPRAEYKTRSA